MKKKLLVIFLSLACAIACAVGLAACDFTNSGNSDKLDVAGYSYTFSSVEIKCEDEKLKKFADLLKQQTEQQMQGSNVSFLKDGSYIMSAGTDTERGTYTQTANKCTITFNGVTNDMAITENSISISQFMPYSNDGEEKPEIPSNPDKKTEQPELPALPEQIPEEKFSRAAAVSANGQTGFYITITYVKGASENGSGNQNDCANGKHSFKWAYDSERHWQECKNCGNETEYKMHYLNNGECKECGYVKESCTKHTLGVNVYQGISEEPSTCTTAGHSALWNML